MSRLHVESRYIAEQAETIQPILNQVRDEILRVLPNTEYPYWAFKDIYSVEASGDSRIIKLEVPVEAAVFLTCTTGTRYSA